MATSPNFGWLEPDNTDLVKNGALAIRTLGNAIDASLVDLKGGTTGQVLAKASNTDMDFVWAADAGAPTSLGFAAGKNVILNGDFRLNQRAFTSLTCSGTDQYGFDRWLAVSNTGTVTYSTQAFTAGAAPVAGYEAINFARMVTSGQSTGTAYAILSQKIEDVRTDANQTVTISFWAKAASGTPKIAVELTQNFGSGGSGAVNTYAGQATISTSWTRYSVSVAVPSISGKTVGTSSFLQVNLWVSAGTDFNARTGSIGIQSATFDIWGVQLEAGSTATAFQTATGTLQGELAACQRYYYEKGGDANYEYHAACSVSSTTEAFGTLILPVQMRVTPSGSVSAAADFACGSSTGVAQACTAVAFQSSGTKSAGIKATTGGGLAAGNSSTLFSNNTTSARIKLSAEL
jgi:hypothetical protein